MSAAEQLTNFALDAASLKASWVQMMEYVIRCKKTPDHNGQVNVNEILAFFPKETIKRMNERQS
jgi:hypothetical protein